MVEELERPPDGPAGKEEGWFAPLCTGVLFVILAVIRLRLQDRPLWCSCGEPSLWAGQVNSLHNSQHVFDPYSFTHILHGFLLCGFLWIVARNLHRFWKVTVTVGMECLWELLENSRFVIEKYRTATISFGYLGDSIANSLGDILCCATGFLIASRIGGKRALAVFLLVEMALLMTIRDSLTLNIIMLLHPVPAIRAWQLGNSP